MRKLACLLSVVAAITACGKKGPLIYPEMLVPAAPSNVSVQQTGKSIKLSFILPTKDLAGRNIDTPAIVKIQRDAPPGQSPGCSSCTSDFHLFRTLNLDLLPPETERYGTLLVLMDGDVQANRTYTYRVSTLAKDDQEGTLSAPVATLTVAPVLPPVLQVVSQPTEIQLEFAGLPPNEGVIAGYNVYRAVKGRAFPLLPLNGEPLVGNRFTDTGLERGISYVYGVRSVVRLPSGSRIESTLSSEMDGKLKDGE